MVSIVITSIILLSNYFLTYNYNNRLEDYYLNEPKANEARVIIKPSIFIRHSSFIAQILKWHKF